MKEEIFFSPHRDLKHGPLLATLTPQEILEVGGWVGVSKWFQDLCSIGPKFAMSLCIKMQ